MRIARHEPQEKSRAVEKLDDPRRAGNSAARVSKVRLGFESAGQPAMQLPHAYLLCLRKEVVLPLPQNSFSNRSSVMSTSNDTALLYEFRIQYHSLNNAVREAFANGSDTIVLERLSDRIGEYISLVHEVCVYVLYPWLLQCI